MRRTPAGDSFALPAPLLFAVVLAAALLSGLVAGCGSWPPVAAKIAAFDPPSGSHAAGAGYTPEATLRLQNTGTQDRTFWVGYSVRDPKGEWHDAPLKSIELASGKESTRYELSAPPVAHLRLLRYASLGMEREPGGGRRRPGGSGPPCGYRRESRFQVV